MINVTKPFLPPRAEFDKLVDGIWERAWLTNQGPLVTKLETSLEKYLGVNNFLFTNNGTIPLQIAYQALDLKGEVITTPFSYVATASSIVWEKCTPVFVDIDEATFNIDPKLIEAAITEKTTGIVATHVFGNPCDIQAIDAIAEKHNLKVVYDAAHCFGTKYKGESVLNFGDVSTISFHATKLFHTTEGGGAVVKSENILYRMSQMRNFGHTGPYSFDCVGINGKNSELHAAMGLCNLKYIDNIIEARKKQYLKYKENLKTLPIKFQHLQVEDNEYNYAYFPILLPSEDILLKVIDELNGQYVNPRRYFYPSLNTISYVENVPCPVSERTSCRVLCLPLFHDLSGSTIDMITNTIIKTFKFKKE